MGQVSVAGGAVSLVVLDPVNGTAIQPVEPKTILSLDIAATVGSACSTCTLTLSDGQYGLGRPLTNVLSSAGRSYAPVLPTASVEICSE